MKYHALGCAVSGAAALFVAAGPMPAPGAISYPAGATARTAAPHAPAPQAPAPEAPALDAPRRTAPGPAPLVLDREARTLSFEAVAQPGAFDRSLPPDHRYHAIVHREGSAAGKALFVTDAPDTTIARALRELGADDGGGVPMSAWNLRWLPLVPQPDSRVAGSLLRVEIEWEGAERAYTLEELLQDPGGRGLEVRFGGNEEHDHHWPSGCILCLFSCPGGVMSNAAYSIRDHQRGRTEFEPGPLLPPSGTPVTITIAFAPG